MHTDTFGRTWIFTPGHNPDKMLQLSHDVAAIGYNANHALRTGDTMDRYREAMADQPMEPYLLKNGKDGWYMGMRYGDSGSEYISPGLDAGIIQMMIALHRRKCSAQEAMAVVMLVDGE